MKISTKGRYGLTVMINLAKEYGEGPISLKTIAQENNLSEHYLEQIICPLRNSGLVKSVRGAYGGYKLTNEPSKITVGDIIYVLEGPINVVDSIEDEEPEQKELWLRIRNAVREVLDNTTLQDLVNHKDDEHKGYMFYI